MTAPSSAIPTPRPAGDNADREWACTFLSKVRGREVRGGLLVEELVARLREGEEAGR